MSGSNKINIGFFGGSFNPIHLGHLIIAEFARIEFNLESIIFIPTGNPGYGKDSLSTGAEHRFNMVLLAISDNPFFFSSRIEVEQNEPTYTINTLKKLRETYNPDIYGYYYIVGLDSALDLSNWKEPYEVLNYTSFAVGTRWDYSSKEFYEKLSPFNKYFSKIHLFKMPIIEISSRLIRDRIKDGNSIKYLVPNNVEEYIVKNNLYKKGG